jgi:prepilin-type N-terminal cleavage/methylation domain-containing protein
VKKQSQRGYNLVELLVAIAVLGVVLLSIMSLFIWGRKNVYSGKQMTTAISIGTKVLEDIGPMTKKDLYNGLFGIQDADAPTASVKFGTPEREYKSAAIRSTNASIISGYTGLQGENADGPKLLTGSWTNELKDAAGKAKLDDGAVTIIMRPRLDTTTAAAKFGDATVLQVRVVVSWLENRRRREVILDTVKAQ